MGSVTYVGLLSNSDHDLDDERAGRLFASDAVTARGV